MTVKFSGSVQYCKKKVEPYDPTSILFQMLLSIFKVATTVEPLTLFISRSTATSRPGTI